MEFKLPKLKLKNVVSDDSSEDEKDLGNDDLGLTLEKLNLGPRKKLLVLNLGGLLVHRLHRREEYSVRKHGRPDFISGNFLVFKRPFCDQFLRFCFQRFEVGIWSAAMQSNIDGVLSSIMGGLQGKLVFVWDQGECTDSGFRSLEKKEKPIFLKELKKLWEKKYSTLPWRIGQYSSTNTLLIDDDPYTALLNPPNTAIFPQKYKAGDLKDTYLGPKGEMQLFLEGLEDADDVPTYVKEHPFGQPAITPSHTYWGFYSKIIRCFRNGKDAERKI